MTHGRLSNRALRRATQAILDDSYQRVQVLRGRYGEEKLVAEFSTRIAPTSSATRGLDGQTVSGDSAAQMYVIHVPENLDVRKGDEVWTTAGQRYRVVYLATFPGELQALAEAIQ
jgi:hypothetical protein